MTSSSTRTFVRWIAGQWMKIGDTGMADIASVRVAVAHDHDANVRHGGQPVFGCNLLQRIFAHGGVEHDGRIAVMRAS